MKYVLLLSISLLFSCVDKSQYKYIELISSPSGIKQSEGKTIVAGSDSAAYYRACELLSISKYAHETVPKELGRIQATGPIGFRLYNFKGDDIVTTGSLTVEKMELIMSTVTAKIQPELIGK